MRRAKRSGGRGSDRGWASAAESCRGIQRLLGTFLCIRSIAILHVQGGLGKSLSLSLVSPLCSPSQLQALRRSSSLEHLARAGFLDIKRSSHAEVTQTGNSERSFLSYTTRLHPTPNFLQAAKVSLLSRVCRLRTITSCGRRVPRTCIPDIVLGEDPRAYEAENAVASLPCSCFPTGALSPRKLPYMP